MVGVSSILKDLELHGMRGISTVLITLLSPELRHPIVGLGSCQKEGRLVQRGGEPSGSNRSGVRASEEDRLLHPAPSERAVPVLRDGDW